MGSETNKYQAELLRNTLHYVSEKLPYYRQFSGRTELRIDEFPLIDAEIMRERYDDLVVLDSFPDIVNLTGGSSGTPTLVFQSATEWERRYKHACGIHPGERIETGKIPGFVLHVHGRNHGIPYTTAHGFPYIRLPLGNRGHARVIANLLAQGLTVGGRKIFPLKLIASSGGIRRLTAYLFANEFDVESIQLKTIGIYGKHISSHWINKLSSYWRTPVRIETYGLTEFNYAVAKRCYACGGYHFPETIYPEWFSPDRSHAVNDGEALLVLTSLFPFVEVQPRVRFVTNDLVRILPECEANGQKGFDFLGRLERSVLVSEDNCYRTILTAVDVLEAIDLTNFVRVDSDDSYPIIGDLVFDESFPFPPGYAMFEMRVPQVPGAGGEISLLVELQVDPTKEPDKAQQVSAELRNNVFKVRPRLENDLETFNYTLRIETLAKGGLLARGLSPVKAY